MTRKDFQLIADVISKHIAYWEQDNHAEELDSLASANALKDLALSLGGEFTSVNPRFDTKRFLKACSFYAE